MSFFYYFLNGTPVEILTQGAISSHADPEFSSKQRTNFQLLYLFNKTQDV